MNREEQIEKARELLACGVLSKEACDAIKNDFPELRESEDERIRQFLVELLSSGTWKKEWPFQPNECVAYLEKLKEQPKEELVYRLNGLMQDYIKDGKDEEEREHRLKCYQLFWDALEDAEFFQQKEQKPAWSEEDEDFINMLILHFNYLIDKGGDSVETYKSYREKLKSLRPQYHGDVTMTEAYKMGFEAGKASSWKPSEEQMKALDKALDYLPEGDMYDWVSDLYYNLKKLM